MSTDIVSCLKYGDECYSYSGYVGTYYEFSSPYASCINGVIKNNTTLNVLVKCAHCGEKSKHSINTVSNFFQCTNCGWRTNVYTRYNQYKNKLELYGYFINDYWVDNFKLKIVNTYEDVYIVRIGNTEKKNKISFRCGYVPNTKKHKHSHSSGGRTRKGLQFSTYKHSIDYQWVDENHDDNPIIFKHKHSHRVYVESGMSDYDLPMRHRIRKSWKRSKKRFQWM